MKSGTPPLTRQQQADLLMARGMQGDRATIMGRLAVVNYYRLSGYWHPFRDVSHDAFLTICKYCLDRIAPQSRWADRLHGLLDGASNIPLDAMGFPANWEQCPI